MPHARNGDVRIHYTVEGDGPPLVLHHGFTGSGKDWESFGFTDGLKDRFQLIMLDALGHGASDKPHDQAVYGFENAARDVVAVLDDLGIAQAHYYGYSLGGMMGWALGKYAPQRFASLAIGGAHPYEFDEAAWARFYRMRDYLQQGMPAYVAWREEHGVVWPPAFKERVLQNDARALLAYITADAEAQRAHTLEDALPRMTMPVLVISGDDDELFAGSRARRAADALPDARYVEIENADHPKLYLRGDLILPHLTEFLASVTAECIAS